MPFQKANTDYERNILVFSIGYFLRSLSKNRQRIFNTKKSPKSILHVSV